ncbi:MAG: type II secretion system F family protein [Phycisphaerales bacterium]|jgi:type IV pilus assembly protein PilC|nr:type II secretion system F family protein [Phycisphaerales bacterium]
MATFAFTARDQAGLSATGTLSANSIAEVSQMLRAEGKYPITVRPAGEMSAITSGPAAGANIKISRADVIQFATQLAVMTETGVTLSEALECIAAQSVKPNVKALITDISTQVHGGSDFSSALGRHPRSFPRLFIALIKASEKSGMMSKLLVRATQYLRDEQETMRKVKGALTYPGIMLGFAITTTIFLLIFVLPRFTAIYASKSAALPLPTKILMNLSDGLIHHWILILISATISGTIGYLYLHSAQGMRLWHYLQLRIPLLGPMFRQLYLARGLRMVGTMGSAGVNLVDCVATARDLCGNTYFREMWEEVSEQIQVGKQLSEPLFQSNLVPRPISQMLHSGEKGGKLSQVMEQVAGFSEVELKERIAGLTRYIEPIMIMVMGLIIGGVAMALLLPIFTISRVMAS